MRHTARTVSGAVSAVAAILLLVGCAGPPPAASWVPPSWPGAEDVELAPGAKDEASAEANPEGVSGEAVALGAAAEPALTAGLVDGRIRNDGAALQARYVELQGQPAFNERVAGILGAAIAGTGVPVFVPEAHGIEAGLGERGCMPGATERSGAELLADPLVGPVGGGGTAVVCELTATFGSILGVTFRTVVGANGEVAADTSVGLLVDLATGEIYDGAALWQPEAAEELWLGVVHDMQREAGALSAAPLQVPGEEQLALARAALAVPVFTQAGQMTVTLPAGVTSPELEDLGVDTTTVPTSVTVTVPSEWLSPAGESVLAQRETPFAGVPEWTGRHPVDCDIVACVAVTYDDGPSGFTSELLDVLAVHEAPATFFMLGSAVHNFPDVVARAATEGHELASHSMTHPDLTSIPAAQARKQVLDAGTAITGINGEPVTMYRPPYGALNAGVVSAVGLPAILWTVDTLDWQAPGIDALVDRSVGVAKPGDIILFHDTHADTVNAAGQVFEGLRARGFTPVTVSQLFEGAVPKGRVTGR